MSIDIREAMKNLDENTRRAFLGKQPRGNYDASVFVEAIENDGERYLYVPGAKRVRWFKVDHPTGVVFPDTPIYTGKRVTVVARVYNSIEDYQKNLPCAINSCTRILSDDIYEVDSVVTRAMSRALRDAGYDLPRDAHIIEGWTPVKTLKSGASVPEEALESSTSTAFIPIGLPGVVAAEKPAATEESSATDTSATAVPAQDAQSENDEKKSEITPENVFSIMVPASKLVSPAKHRGCPRKHPIEETDKPVEEPKKSAEEPKAENNSADEEKPDDLNTVPEANAGVENTAIPAPFIPVKKDVPDSFDGLFEKAKTIFDSYEAAMAYSSKLLSWKTVGEQRDERIAFYVRKAMKGTLTDEMLGYACAIAAKERDLTI